MAKVRAAQQALDKALAEIYTHGPGSSEGEAAAANLPKLKADLAHALDDLGRLPDYNSIDPSSVNVTPDGHFYYLQRQRPARAGGRTATTAPANSSTKPPAPTTRSKTAS